MGGPVQVVIFGASGDLAARKLIPALSAIAAKGVALSIVGVSRREKSDAEWREELREWITPDLAEGFERLAPHLHYVAGDAASHEDLERLSGYLDGLPGGRETGRLFYLSLKPELFAPTVRQLAGAGMLRCREGEQKAFRRVVIEKPFGHDLATARRLNEQLHEVLLEEQVYRIDHYLGKETVQNILGFRFHNAIFEPVWNRHHVELVQITAAEDIGIEHGRAGYYDGTGALRDMIQNHLLQVLALVAMEPPTSLHPEAIRGQKKNVLMALHPPMPDEVPRMAVRARYKAGRVGGEQVRGYLEEQGVPADSNTETYAAIRAELDSWRWSGTPFFLRHGKRLAKKTTEIQVQFRTPPLQLFNKPQGVPDEELRRLLHDGSLCQIRPNVLTISIQPREAITLSFGVKRPGSQMTMAPAKLSFDYREAFGGTSTPAYERLLQDALAGDATLFLRSDEIEASWRFADAFRHAWDAPDAPPLLEYAAGSWGPAEADELFHGCEGGWSHG